LDTEKKSLNALLEIMTLVASANNNGSYTEFILRGRPFIQLWTTEALELIPGELHDSMYPGQRKNF